MTKPADWKWFGISGHFICGAWCRFHLCTRVGKYLVSTVGEYVHPRHSGSSEQSEAAWLKENWPGEEIGIGRKYETMVFRAGKSCQSKEDGRCGTPELILPELDSGGYNTRGDAQRGHLRMCRKW